MLNTIKLHFSQNRSLFIAAFISLLLHILFLSGFKFVLPDINEYRQVLEMRLVSLPPTQKTIAAATPEPRPEPRPEPQPQAKPEQNNIDETPVESTQTIETSAETIIDENMPPAKNSPPINPIEPATVAPTDIEAEHNETALDTTEEIAKVRPYKHMEAEFEVRRGNDASAAGTAHITFDIDKNDTYQIKSVTKANGLASLFFNELEQKSEGTVTENGLKPHYYSYQYGKKKSQTASFSWDEELLSMQSAKGNKIEKLAPGTQDFLSFMYQFMFTPPLQTMQITMTNGKNLRTYTYSFEGEEIINSKLGELNTLHLLKTGDEEEKTEIWLGLSYRYLPVKIRKTEKDGSVIEQIITLIDIPQ